MARNDRRMVWLAMTACCLAYPTVYVIVFYGVSELSLVRARLIEKTLLRTIQAIDARPFLCAPGEEPGAPSRGEVLTMDELRDFNDRLGAAGERLSSATLSDEVYEYTDRILSLKLDLVNGIRRIVDQNYALKDYLDSAKKYALCRRASPGQVGDSVFQAAGQVALVEHRAKLEELLKGFQVATAVHAARRWGIAVIAWIVILIEVVGYTCGFILMRRYLREWKAKRKGKTTGAGA